MLRSFVRRGLELDFLRRTTTICGQQSFSSQSNGHDGKGSKGSFIEQIKKHLRDAKEYLNERRQKQWIQEEESEYPFSHIEDVPQECDVLIVGGGVIGSSVAFWLKQALDNQVKVVVIEKDPTYSKASTSLSVGGLRQQFSLEENIRMSLFGAEFLRNINDYLCVHPAERIDPCFHPHGYLMMASEAGVENLTSNSKLQNELGAKNVLLRPDKLKTIFPWLNTEGIALGCLGLENEGWFDPWTLLCAFKRKAMHLGAEYIHGEVTDFILEDPDINVPVSEILDMQLYRKPKSVIVKTPNGETKSISFTYVVIAAGAYSGQIAKMSRIGAGTGIFAIPLPVEPRKRYVYCFHCPDGPGLNTPMTIDPTGTYFRRDGLAGNYICGKSPVASEEPSVDDLSVDHDYFESEVWPRLAHRVKAFENLKVRSSWAGYYEYNTFDANGVIGAHPIYENLLMATGFSGHGIQQAPAIGRALTELIIDAKFLTIDLTRLGFQRFIEGTPLFEEHVV